ncbi:6-hydroxy-D-nicotine oxidase [Rubripirellula tenax]|uniref:6-hydroxy-D-nicotine oxidase n=1 Tax=Rubripirellula tenax TaxID=2528015 RepID=A0A5C6FAX9_9BACT|nr:FAD-binding protein [Rubripirellula tenax]TWU58973.1 6-hydroxy-D-nicotine oxidase [Rubripirellula tenax]
MAKKIARPEVKFSGRVISSLVDFQDGSSDVIGPHHVVYPKTASDVATAVTLSQKAKTFVRSGENATKQDSVDGAGGIVINLKEMNGVTVKGGALRAQAAATSEAVTSQLAEHALALPLADNPLKSIASTVLFETPSYLRRSLGPLSSYISSIRAVRPDGKAIKLKDSLQESCLQKCRAMQAVVTDVEFKPTSAKGLWMHRATFPYPGKKVFSQISRQIFQTIKFSTKLERTDVSLDAFSGPYDIPLVRISVLGSTPAGRTSLKKLLGKAVNILPKTFEPDDIAVETLTGPEVLDALSESGLGTPGDAMFESTSLHDSVDATGDTENFLLNHADNVDRDIAFQDETAGRIIQKTRLTTSLRLNPQNGLDLTGYRHTPIANDSTEIRSRATPLHTGDSLQAPVEFTALVRASPIPNFRGEVFSKNDWGFKSRAHQYATSSYSSTRMTPFMLAYPRDDGDIVAAIQFARSQGKHVVARSGGHQYSGKSSGGSDTIVLSLDHFDQLDHLGGSVFRVGPAVRLVNVATRFKNERVTIPHGECPQVAIGGHAQTGGYGHLIRSFGLCTDYVTSFDIILADGSKRTVGRPREDTTTTPENDELFWGVLGGNAGSFGIVTSYEFDCIEDVAHPNSYGFTFRRRYKESAFRKLMKEAQKWTKQIADKTLDPDLDFMMSVGSSRSLFPFPGLVVELVHGNLGGASQVVDGEQAFKPIIRASKHRAGIWNLFATRGKDSLSSLSLSFVRSWPLVTRQGREFVYPYKKRVNCTVSKLSNEFVDEFVQKVSHIVLNESKVKLVFQMSFGGGAFRDSARRDATSIPQRDSVYTFVFDLFYKQGGEQIAESLQSEVQDLIARHFNGSQERRVFWGTFGNTDIKDASVRKMYYDSDSQYRRLQKLKQTVDPDNLFQTSLTVQLPDQRDP